MKKLISVLCVIAVLLSLSVVAFAAEDTQNSQKGQAPSDEPQMNGQRPSGPPDVIDFDDMVSKGVISQETCDKIKAYMEEHKPADLPEMDGQGPDGEAPTDLPELPDMNGQPPQMSGQAPDMGGQPPQMNGQAPSMGGQPPQMSGQAPDMGGQPPQMNGQALNGDAPAALPELPDMNGEFPEMEGATSAKGGLLNDLLNNSIITQAEYDALIEAINK
jgi:hypothetical protein